MSDIVLGIVGIIALAVVVFVLIRVGKVAEGIINHWL
jgi:preprotein translocase subunit SecG